jgi:hypothetical protein
MSRRFGLGRDWDDITGRGECGEVLRGRDILFSYSPYIQHAASLLYTYRLEHWKPVYTFI